MSAEVLRRAASLMRERADSASGSPWQHIAIEDEAGCCDGYVISLTSFSSIGEDVGESMAVVDAEHIASWHPAVARAVAALLVSVGIQCDLKNLCDDSPEFVDALTVARAYLGESA